MKIVRVAKDGQPAWGIAEGDQVFALLGDPYSAPEKGEPIGTLADLKLLSPILPDNRVIIILDNWRGKMGREWPSFVFKNSKARINPGETVIYPKIATKVFFETELGIVIGKEARGVSVEQARDHIMGYTINNDMTAFDFNIDVGTDKVLFGKGLDTFSCLGPCIATGLDPRDLTLRGAINGDEFYATSTGLMTWDAYELVSWVSQVTALFPGDVISCGAAPGALSRETKPGDRVTLRIDEIGEFDLDVRPA